MATLRNFIPGLTGLFLLTQCNTKQESNTARPISQVSAKTKSKNLVTGEWQYSNTIWYSSALTLKDNGTFEFHDQGCYGKKISEGIWNNDNGTIWLTSFDTFKQKEQSPAVQPAESAEKDKTRHRSKRGAIKYSVVGFNDLPLPVLPGPNDTVLIYFNHVQLQLRNDTLYCVGSDKLPEEAKLHRSK